MNYELHEYDHLQINSQHLVGKRALKAVAELRQTSLPVYKQLMLTGVVVVS